MIGFGVAITFVVAGRHENALVEKTILNQLLHGIFRESYTYKLILNDEIFMTGDMRAWMYSHPSFPVTA